MITFKCPCCGARMTFRPEDQKMHCDYCGTVKDLNEYNDALEEKGQFVATEYSCTQCGAVIMATDATAATFCSYCGAPVALTGNMAVHKAPKKIIPFQLNRSACLNAYEKRVRKAIFAPDWMLDKGAEQKFRGIYMPYYSHHLSGESYLNSTAVSHYTLGGFDYTDTYLVSGTVRVDFDNIVGDASVAFPDTMSYNIGKPNPNKEVPFKLSYLSGFYADLSDIREDRVFDFAKELATARMLKDSQVPVNMGGHIASVNVGPAVAEIAEKGLDSATDTVMNPVWFLSNRRGDKISYAAVDGVDGDVAVDIPIDFKKYLLVTFVVCGILSLAFNLLDFVPSPESVLVWSVVLALAGWLITGREYNKLWRRKNGYDDLGAMDDDTFLKLRESMGKSIGRLSENAKNAKTKMSGKTGLIILCIIIAIPLLPILASAIGFVVPAFFIYSFVKAAGSSSGGKKRTKARKYKAPIQNRLLRALPFLAVIFVSLGAKSVFAEKDTIQYLVAFGAIAVNVVMGLNLVRMQNDYAMRDIPVFTEKRGGDM